MRIELKYKEVFEVVWKAINGVIGGKYDFNQNICVECPTNLTWKLRKDGDDVLVEFPINNVKVSAAKWIFQLDGSITGIRIRKDKVMVEVAGMPDLEIFFV